MVFRLNLAFLVALGLGWAAHSTGPAEGLVETTTRAAAELAALEDAVARNAEPPEVRMLAETYVAMDRSDLAVAILQANDGALIVAEPGVGYLLARAYERQGRMSDAIATAELARQRCARALGVLDAPPVTEVPQGTCTMGELARLEVHATALERMFAWGVSNPRTDPRAAVAYALASRTARIASND